MDWLKKIAFDFVTSGYHDRLEAEARRKIILLNIVCLTGTVVLVLMGALSIFQNNLILWLIDWLVAVILIVKLQNLIGFWMPKTFG